ncbi:MAG TPA: sulfate adenylyltransferase [Candidatus Angelobacter sp.]|jgi:sulfate adenylyltransferase|nr:sulfate adenylyltransferase [Candidatus Angelobacter sp.]
MSGLVAPLGGTLVDRRAAQAEAAGLRARAEQLPSIELSSSEQADLELIADGAYSPIAGFLTRNDYESVVERAELGDGTPWTLPITLTLTEEQAAAARPGAEVALRDAEGALRGVLTVDEVFSRDVEREASEVYRTTDDAHPGVTAMRRGGSLLVGGPVTALPASGDAQALTPAQTRKSFAERDWNTVVAFQTRNPVHRAHEYLTKVALEQVDGLLLHPLVGATKDDDIPAPVRMRCYDVLLRNYYPAQRVLLATFPAAMRYAGPREAVYHGLVRRNYGCTHFIIGRDAAGVGNYYGTYDAQLLYDELGGAARLGYTAFKFEHTFWCNACESMASARTCPHDREQHVMLSGTAVRKLLSEGGDVPHTFTRPEVAEVLREAYSRPAGEALV